MTPPKRAIVILPLAEADVADAALWYDRQRPGLGSEFVVEVRSTITRAAENALLHPRVRRRPDVRRVMTRRFPYRVFFVPNDDAIVVFRVLHSARHDLEWKSHVPED